LEENNFTLTPISVQFFNFIFNFCTSTWRVTLVKELPCYPSKAALKDFWKLWIHSGTRKSLYKTILMKKNFISSPLLVPFSGPFSVKEKQLNFAHTFVFFSNRKVSTSVWEGGARPILTNAFLEQMRNIMENLSNTKVLKVT